MKSWFQLDADSAPGPTPALTDPQAFDVHEQQFAARMEEKSVQPAPRFVLEHAKSPDSLLETSGAPTVVNQKDTTQAEGQDSKEGQQVPAMVLESPGQPAEPDSWRREVAARVNHYRGKRPRVPRYPSLQLRFESAEPTMIAQPAGSQAREITTCGQLAITMDPGPAPAIEIQAEQPSAAPPDGANKILEFPRSSFMPPVILDELAEPVFHRPRILEVPEVLPPPPALGGISIEPSEELKDERRPSFETPLKPAQLTRRILAGMTDALIVVTSFAGFAYIFFRITSFVPPLRQGMEVAAALLAGFWAAYQYLLLIRAGSTPGLKLAKLELSRFDGRPVPRSLRRWRVLASVLSGLSLGLGYAWCFLDEDELCWHDRITHTYMAPKAAKSLPVTDKLRPNVLDF
jgi:uncharacterized RDD family membrane protein YckC